MNRIISITFALIVAGAGEIAESLQKERITVGYTITLKATSDYHR